MLALVFVIVPFSFVAEEWSSEAGLAIDLHQGVDEGILGGKNWKADALVLVQDANGQPMAGATVYGIWWFNRVVIQSDALAITGAGGSALLTSTPEKANAGDTFTFEVTDIFADGHIYDPALNKETSDSIAP